MRNHDDEGKWLHISTRHIVSVIMVFIISSAISSIWLSQSLTDYGFYQGPSSKIYSYAQEASTNDGIGFDVSHVLPTQDGQQQANVSQAEKIQAEEPESQDDDNDSDSDFHDEQSDDVMEESFLVDPQLSQNGTITDGSVDDVATIDENDIVAINILVNDRLLFGSNSSLRIDALSKPLYGSVATNFDDTVTYSPYQLPLSPDSILSDFFNYTVSVENGAYYHTGKVTITIKQVNDAPIAFDSQHVMKKDSNISFVLNGYDEDGDDLSFSISKEPTFGQYILYPETGIIAYEPYLDFEGEDLIEYTVSDGRTTGDPALIKLIIDDKQAEQNSDNYYNQSESTDGENEESGYDDSGSDQSNNSEDNGNSDTNTGTENGDQNTNNNDNSTSDTNNNNDNSTSDTNNNNNDTSSSNGGTNSNPIVKIDIMPGIYPNEINTNKVSQRMQVAILGSSSLNISHNLDYDSLQFGPAFATPVSEEFRDVDGDGFTDFIGYYTIGDLGLKSTDTKACQTGNLQFNGEIVSFEACDSIKVINQNNKN